MLDKAGKEKQLTQKHRPKRQRDRKHHTKAMRERPSGLPGEPIGSRAETEKGQNGESDARENPNDEIHERHNLKRHFGSQTSTLHPLKYKRERGEDGENEGAASGDLAPTEGDAPLGDTGEGKTKDEIDAVRENEGADDVTHDENQR